MKSPNNIISRLESRALKRNHESIELNRDNAILLKTHEIQRHIRMVKAQMGLSDIIHSNRNPSPLRSDFPSTPSSPSKSFDKSFGKPQTPRNLGIAFGSRIPTPARTPTPRRKKSPVRERPQNDHIHVQPYVLPLVPLLDRPKPELGDLHSRKNFERLLNSEFNSFVKSSVKIYTKV